MKWIVELIIVGVLVLYAFLAGEGFNIYLLWSYLALIYSLAWSIRLTISGKRKSAAFWGFLLGSNLFMLPIHISWYFDIGGAKTGGSTSALIFAVMPVWAFIAGAIFGGLSYALNKLHH